MNQYPARPRTIAAGRHIALGLLALLVGCDGNDLTDVPEADQPLEAPTPATPSRAGISSSGCAGYSYARLINVSSSSQLLSAFNGARAGDLIRMADGVYKGYWRITRSGTSGQPIVLCGSRNAVIDGGGFGNGGFVLQFHGVSHWVVDGITVRNQNQGVEIRGGGANVVRNIECHTLGQGCIHLWMHTNRNVIERNWIHHTGLRNAEYGEGIYVGSTRWSTTGGPDRSDGNLVVGNRIGPEVRSEHIDVKAGAKYNDIRDNILDGAGQVWCTAKGVPIPACPRATPWVNSWIEVTGSDNRITGNTGSRALKFGYGVQRADLKSDGSRCSPGTAGCVSYGARNVFEGNHADLSGAKVPGGAAIGIESGAQGAVVRCSNTRTPTSVPLAKSTYSGAVVACT